MPTCDICKDLNPNEFEKDGDRPAANITKIPRAVLIARVQAGCKTCAIVQEARMAVAAVEKSPLSLYMPTIVLERAIEDAPLHIYSISHGGLRSGVAEAELFRLHKCALQLRYINTF